MSDKLHMRLVDLRPGYKLFQYHYKNDHGYVKFANRSGAWQYSTFNPLKEPQIFNGWLHSVREFFLLADAKRHFKHDFLGIRG